LVVLKSGVDRDHGEIVTELIAMVRDQIGPVAAFRRVVVVARLPKTRSGKVLRGMVRKLADGEGFSPPATIEDPSVLEDLRAMIGPSREQVGHAR
jgi:propionyl-CoA synthetase